MTPDELFQLREDMLEDLARPISTSPGQQHVRALVDPLKRIIAELCDALLAAQEIRT